MKKSLLLLAALGLPGIAAAQGHEFGRVLSSTPVIQQVAVPRQVCTSQPVAVDQHPSGAGALMGALAGGAMGNAIGDGSGRAAATVIGIVGGAIAGNRIEGAGTQVHNATQCTTQTFYENRAVAYNVTYEYAGRQYTVQLPQDPGPTVRLQVTPVVTAQPQDGTEPQGAYAPAAVVQEVVTVAPTVVYQPYPGYYPGYYYRPYYPIGISLNFGYSRGWGHRHHRHR